MLEQLNEFLSDQIHDHWLKVLMGLGLMLVGWFLGKYRARGEWRRREFFHRLNVSLNILQPGQPLRIRTLIEKPCSEIFLNSAASEAVLAAARRTTATNPLLPLPKDEYWFYLNAVVNEVAEKFAVGELRRDLGLPVTMAKYLICLTCENVGELRTRKIRAMVIKKSTLQSLPKEVPTFENPWHKTRWETLQILSAEYAKNPHQFIELELAV
uniref:Uncharacterized protein n=1 Tax=Schlesneria paludicola TaxID=360056 RepID=A0A7C2K1T3_9PLAN